MIDSPPRRGLRPGSDDPSAPGRTAAVGRPEALPSRPRPTRRDRARQLAFAALTLLTALNLVAALGLLFVLTTVPLELDLQTGPRSATVGPQTGPAPNGPAPNGPAPNGPAPNGPAPNGLGPNGLGPNGPGANGPAPNGPGANGLGPGVVAPALRTTALRATALRATALRATALRATALRATDLRATDLRATDLDIPKLGIRSGLLELGVDPTGALQTPTAPDVAGWFTGAAAPGELGPTVIAGHVDSTDGPGVFYALKDLARGDLIVLGRSDGRAATYRVTDVLIVDKDRFPTQQVYGPTAGAELRLITCGGSFDRVSGHYLRNVVVSGVLVERD